MPFNPSRLALARRRRGLSHASLARLCDISLRSVGRYESGASEPFEETVIVLADKLEFPAAFFYGPDLEEIGVDFASFRSLSRMTASQRDAALASGSLALALSEWIDKRFELPPISVPDLRNFDPETAAQVLRVEWGLGERPVPNIVHLLEAHGVRVFSLPTDSQSVDAFSVRHRETPFVFLSPMKSAERWRMDAAHELGHLVLHHGHGIPRSREAELEADAFAGAFLMPEGDVLAHVPRGITVEKVLQMKLRWRIAAIALVHRLKALRVLTEWQYRSHCIELSKRGYRRDEDEINRDNSQVFAKIFETLRAEGVSRSGIARDLTIHPAELDALLVGLVIASLPSSQTSNTPKNIREKSGLRIV